MGDCCTNRAFRRNEQIEKLRVFYAPNRGFGLYTDVPIKAGVLIIEYRGEIISTAKCIERNDTIYSGQKKSLFFGIWKWSGIGWMPKRNNSSVC
ncbi:hypothetical protein MT418_007514 [Batrachochytrium dendrobatidis]